MPHPRVSVQSPGITMADLEEVESPRRPRRSAAPTPGEYLERHFIANCLYKSSWKMTGSLVEPGRIKSSTKGNLLEDVTEDKEGEKRLEEEEEEEFFDENEEAVKAPSQLGEDQDALGRQVRRIVLPQETQNFIELMCARFFCHIGFWELWLQDPQERCIRHERKGMTG